MKATTKLGRAIAVFPVGGHDDQVDALPYAVHFQQSQLGSLIEVGFSTCIGFLVGLFAQVAIFPLLGIHADWRQNLAVSIIFTAISVVRGYVIRRWFNARLHRAAMQLAARIES